MTNPMGPIAKAALLAAALPVCFGLYSIGIILPQMEQAFASTPHATLLSQLVGGVPGLAFAIFSPLAGRLVERLGVRGVYMWSMALFAVAGTSAMLFDNLYLILMTRIVVGAAVAGTLIAAMTGIGLLPQEQRARMLGFFTLVGGVLSLLLYYVVARLAQGGWRPAFSLHLLALPTLVLLLALPRGPATSAPVSEPTAAAGPATGLPPFSLMAIALFLGMAGVLPGLFAPFYLASIGVHDPSQIMIPLIFAAIAVMPAAASYGWFQRRLGIGGMFAACFLFTGLGSALAGMAGTVMALSGAMAVMTLGLGVSAANLNAAAVVVAPTHPGRTIGIVNGIFYGAQALLPFVAQGLQSAFGIAGVFEVFAAISLVLAAIYASAALRGRREAAAVGV